VTTSGPEPTAGRVPLERIMGKPISVHVPAEADAPGVAAAVAAAFDEFVSGHKVAPVHDREATAAAGGAAQAVGRP
jgi:hypothetical protein